VHAVADVLRDLGARHGVRVLVRPALRRHRHGRRARGRALAVVEELAGLRDLGDRGLALRAHGAHADGDALGLEARVGRGGARVGDRVDRNAVGAVVGRGLLLEDHQLVAVHRPPALVGEVLHVLLVGEPEEAAEGRRGRGDDHGHAAGAEAVRVVLEEDAAPAAAVHHAHGAALCNLEVEVGVALEVGGGGGVEGLEVVGRREHCVSCVVCRVSLA